MDYLSWQNRKGSVPINSSNLIHYASCQAPFRNNRFKRKYLTFHGTVAKWNIVAFWASIRPPTVPHGRLE
jgi:hypothetical protein